MEFEPTISADERPQTYALDRAANRSGQTKSIVYHRENRYLNVVRKAGWAQESVQARQDERNVLPPQGIYPRLQLRPTYNPVTIPTAPFSQYYYSTPHPHTYTPSPYTHPRTPSLRHRCVDKSVARPGRKQATVTEDFEFHISYVVYVFLLFVHVFLSLSMYTYCCLCILRRGYPD